MTSSRWLLFVFVPCKLSKDHFAYCSSKREASLRDLNVVTVIVKNNFLISNLNLLSVSLKPLPLFLSLHALVTKSLCIFSINPFQALQGCNEFSPEPPPLQAEQSQLSLPFFGGEMLEPFDHLLALLLT